MVIGVIYVFVIMCVLPPVDCGMLTDIFAGQVTASVIMVRGLPILPIRPKSSLRLHEPKVLTIGTVSSLLSGSTSSDHSYSVREYFRIVFVCSLFQ